MLSRPTAPLHTAYLVQDFPPEVGAGPARVTEMSRRWQELGVRVTVVTGMPNRRIPGRGEGTVDSRYRGKLFLEEDWDGIRTLRSWVYASESQGFKARIINNASFMTTGLVHALTRAGRPDVIIASSPPFLPHVSGVLFARARNVPLILEIRDLWPDYLVGMGVLRSARLQRALFSLERWLIKQANHVVVVTQSFADRVVQKGAARDRVTVIPNGVDTTQYFASSAEAAPFEELKRAPGEFIVGYLGTFGRGQALTNVVASAAIVRDIDPTIRFVLVGDGPDMPTVQRTLAANPSANISVHPPIARESTRAFYNACDACLVPLAPIPIFQETVPSKIFEIMACGRPVIAALSGEGAAIVDGSGGGIRTDPGDPRALADAIIEMRRASDETRREMGRRGRDYVVARYDRTALADRYLQLLTAVAGGASSRARLKSARSHTRV